MSLKLNAGLGISLDFFLKQFVDLLYLAKFYERAESDIYAQFDDHTGHIPGLVKFEAAGGALIVNLLAGLEQGLGLLPFTRKDNLARSSCHGPQCF